MKAKKFIIIFGPPASGKMTVAFELGKLIDYKVFHNHMSIELVHSFFDFGTPAFSRLDKEIRFAIFNEVAKSDVKGLIFTLVWEFNEEEDEKYVQEITDIFIKENWDIHFVELFVDLSERLKRNVGADRLAMKPTKRDTVHSQKVLLQFEEVYRMNTKEGELAEKSLLKLNNTRIDAPTAARKIKEYFLL